MIPILLKALRTGIVSERAPAPREEWRSREAALGREILQILGRALVIRHVDAGSCNGCELELHALNNPYYNLEGHGIRFAASPRHADMLLVTGPVSRNMENPLRIAYAAMPEPKLVVAVGDCGRDGGDLRRGLRDLRRRLEGHPGGRRGARLPAAAGRRAAGHTHRDSRALTDDAGFCAGRAIPREPRIDSAA